MDPRIIEILPPQMAANLAVVFAFMERRRKKWNEQSHYVTTYHLSGTVVDSGHHVLRIYRQNATGVVYEPASVTGRGPTFVEALDNLAKAVKGLA